MRVRRDGRRPRRAARAWTAATRAGRTRRPRRTRWRAAAGRRRRSPRPGSRGTLLDVDARHLSPAHLRHAHGDIADLDAVPDVRDAAEPFHHEPPDGVVAVSLGQLHAGVPLDLVDAPR